MGVDIETFSRGMRRLAGAVTIVTSGDGMVDVGLTATAVTSLSAEPPRLLACINRSGQTFEMISKSRCLSVNVLGVKHLELAQKFAGLTNEKETDRFSDQQIWGRTAEGAPYLIYALVSFHCSVSSILDAASHGIVICDIGHIHIAGSRPVEPLCYMDGDWSTLVSL